jgi:hypothetical protein
VAGVDQLSDLGVTEHRRIARQHPEAVPKYTRRAPASANGPHVTGGPMNSSSRNRCTWRRAISVSLSSRPATSASTSALNGAVTVRSRARPFFAG